MEGKGQWWGQMRRKINMKETEALFTKTLFLDLHQFDLVVKIKTYHVPKRNCHPKKVNGNEQYWYTFSASAFPCLTLCFTTRQHLFESRLFMCRRCHFTFGQFAFQPRLKENPSYVEAAAARWSSSFFQRSVSAVENLRFRNKSSFLLPPWPSSKSWRRSDNVRNMYICVKKPWTEEEPPQFGHFFDWDVDTLRVEEKIPFITKKKRWGKSFAKEKKVKTPRCRILNSISS